MTDTNKRKERQGDNRDNQRGVKRSKGGSGGKWQTPHQKTKAVALASRGSGRIEPGDLGIWATCARGQEGRATEELKAIFDDCAERVFGVVTESDQKENDENSVDDIEASIKKEIESLSTKNGSAKLFSPVHVDIACVLFFKTRLPINPVDFVHKICEEAVMETSSRKSRYVNRLTPMTMMGKATEKGLEEVGRAVIGEHFQLATDEEKEDVNDDKMGYSYAIRPTIRQHTTLKRDAVIKQVASLVGSKHKVDLTKPDKVILVEIYKTVCGMSVVGSDWEALKRFNLAELYPSQPLPKAAAAVKAEPMLKGGKTDEDQKPASPVSTNSQSLDP